MSGLIGTDTVTDLVEAYADKNAGRGKTLSVTGYTVNDGFGGGNYTVTTQTDATGVIGKAALTLTATANTKTYDGTTSAAATPTVSGLIGTDTVTDLVEAYADKNAGRGKTLSVTGYTVNDGFGGGNYAVRTVADSTGAIDQAAITVTGGAATKTFGDPDPALPYQLTLGALFGGDTLTGALTRAPGETAGVYSTLVGSLSAPSNYKLTFVGGQLTITGSPEPTYNAASNLNVYNFDTSSPLSSQVPGVPPGAGDNGEGSGSTSSDLQIHKDNKFKSKNISVSGKGN